MHRAHVLLPVPARSLTLRCCCPLAAPVPVPEKVTVDIKGQTIKVKVRGIWAPRFAACSLGAIASFLLALANCCCPAGGGLARFLPLTLTWRLPLPCCSPDVQGPKGELQRTFHPLVKFEQVRQRWRAGAGGAHYVQLVCGDGLAGCSSMERRDWRTRQRRWRQPAAAALAAPQQLELELVLAAVSHAAV